GVRGIGRGADRGAVVEENGLVGRVEEYAGFGRETIADLDRRAARIRDARAHVVGGHGRHVPVSAEPERVPRAQMPGYARPVAERVVPALVLDDVPHHRIAADLRLLLDVDVQGLERAPPHPDDVDFGLPGRAPRAPDPDR